MQKMKPSEIEIIIIKFLNKEANQKDLVKLDFWLRNDKNIEVFNRFVKTNYLTTLCMDDFDVEKAKLAVKDRLRKNKRKTITKSIYKYVAAASVILLISFPFIFKKQEINFNKKPVITQQPILPGSDKATLTLEDGEQIKLAKGETYVTEKVRSNGENLIYLDNNQAPDKEITYNYLTIPRGGQFFVQLSDGTKVWLNSESQLKYPVEFVEGNPREVELVYGEAYFDVSPSTKHKGASFTVHNKFQKIEVLGTEFNFNAYKEMGNVVTTLVEGKIMVADGKNKELLRPNQQSRLNVKSDKISIATVDVFDFISWKNGFFSFKEMSLNEIAQVLSRWYDVDFLFENAEVKNVKFNGVFNKDQNIEHILTIIQDTKEAIFEKKDGVIIIR